jgi:hypothetical protein
MATASAWILVLLLSSGQGGNGTFAVPGTYPTQLACQHAGTVNSMDHLMPKDGEGGATVAAFICVHH